MFNIELKDNRGTFLAWNALSFAIIMAAGLFGSIIMEAYPSAEGLLLFVSVIAIVAGIAVKWCAYVRRINDLGESKWLTVGMVIPFISTGLWIWCQFFPTKSTEDCL
jgi:uncharacterized membrane protein YhaH (DUF805 family)